MGSNSSELAIETRGLHKVYGSKVAVEDLTLSVARGEVFGFLGPNGAGKTTSVKMLVGLAVPTAGTARLLGRPLGDPEVRKHIGFLPEHFRFHEWLRAREFLDFHGQLLGLSPEERRERIPHVLHLVGLGGREQDKIKAFSKGMLQRIGIAQAILHRPALVFLDEPTSALDPLGRRDVRDLILGLKQEGVTIFLNSHLLSEVEMVCDQVAIIDKGKVIWQGAPKGLWDQELELRVEGCTPELLHKLGEVAQVVKADGPLLTLRVEDPSQVAVIAETVVNSGAKLFQLTPKRLSLEDLFVKLIERGDNE